MSNKIRKEFDNFHFNNPHVYTEIVRLARQVKKRGHKRYGIKAIFEVIRFHSIMETRGDPFKINNNYAPYYSRMVMNENKDLEGFFQLRSIG